MRVSAFGACAASVELHPLGWCAVALPRDDLNSKPDGVALDLIVASATACVLPSRALAELRPQDVEALLTLPGQALLILLLVLRHLDYDPVIIIIFLRPLRV